MHMPINVSTAASEPEGCCCAVLCCADIDGRVYAMLAPAVGTETEMHALYA